MDENESLQRAIDQEILLVAHDPAWSLRFVGERARLLAAFPGYFIDIEHIGSTAVVGLSAKPIVDLLAGVASMEVAVSLNEPLCRCGYTTSPELNASLTDRQWFMRWNQGRRTHHLHVLVHGGENWFRHLRFRDALRANLVLAGRYAELKETLARQHRHDREAYTQAKTAFIRAAIGEA